MGPGMHAGGQLMAWTVGNLKIEPTATAIRATKDNAGDAKIDVAMALFNAVTVMSTHPEPKRRGSYLEHDEIIVLSGRPWRHATDPRPTPTRRPAAHWSATHLPPPGTWPDAP